MAYGAPGSYSMSAAQGRGTPMMSLPKSVVRIGEQAIWSAQSYANGAALANTEQRIFTTPRGQVGQGFAGALSLAETSLKEGGRIPGGFGFSVDAIALQPYLQGGTLATGPFPVVGAFLRNMQANLVVSWDFLQTRIDIAPAVLIGAGGGTFGATADTGAADGVGGSRVALNHGAANVWMYRRSPVELPADATFAIVYTWGGTSPVVDGGTNLSNAVIRCSLMGQFETAIAVG
jgi:hypothetical protein